MTDRQTVTLYEQANGVGFVVRADLPSSWVDPTFPDVLIYNTRTFIRDGNVDDLTLRYREATATTYGLVEGDLET